MRERCEACSLSVPEEYAEQCGRCGSVLCPICEEDGHACCEQEAEPLPMAA
jgi:hypothetical protein